LPEPAGVTSMPGPHVDSSTDADKPGSKPPSGEAGGRAR
jgi:hypothetical protein